MPVLPFTWTAAFVLANERVEITVASSHLNPEPYVSFTGSMGGGAGQIVDSLRTGAEGLENASDITDICDAWDALHLKRIPDLDAAQVALLDSVESLLVIVNGERYGSAPDKLEDIDDADFSNTSDYIDSRDVIKRIETLAAAFEAAGLDPDKLDPASPDYDAQGLEEDDSAHDVAAELKALRDLEDEADGCGDWQHGATLIRESYFEDYARELAEDIGGIDKDAGWPAQFIDWPAAAEALKMDYTAVDFDGETYYVRS